MALDHYICLDTLEIIVLNQTEQIQLELFFQAS